MNIGLIDVDGHNFPNFALMRTSAYHKQKGDNVEWAISFNQYDKVVASKVFTLAQDYGYSMINTKEVVKGGTGYDIASRLPEMIENSRLMDYTIYPQYPFSVQFFSRGCIRKCPFSFVKKRDIFRQ